MTNWFFALSLLFFWPDPCAVSLAGRCQIKHFSRHVLITSLLTQPSWAEVWCLPRKVYICYSRSAWIPNKSLAVYVCGDEKFLTCLSVFQKHTPSLLWWEQRPTTSSDFKQAYEFTRTPPSLSPPSLPLRAHAHTHTRQWKAFGFAFSLSSDKRPCEWRLH